MNMLTRPMLVPALLVLAACSPATTPSAGPADAATIPEAPGQQPAPPPVARDEAPSGPAIEASAAAAPIDQPVEPPLDARGSASIGGAIRDGNRAPPALRVCATPVGGGNASCIQTRAGARDYRIDVAPGRYYLMGWVQAGELKLIAHASQIRCIRAPCPPDELIVVTVAAGQHRDGVDLDGGYIEIPAGWPQPTH